MMGRSLREPVGIDPADAINRWLRAARAESAQRLAEMAVILISPADRIGETVWPEMDDALMVRRVAELILAGQRGKASALLAKIPRKTASLRVRRRWLPRRTWCESATADGCPPLRSSRRTNATAGDASIAGGGS
ncbi:MAG TPA: hypothetical protein VHJ18_24145 [Streptosporangiaceae bacterium]|jgi:hypothetical protein|nr:hypothetical protein [Streptosporangiaceae bacterium]